MKWIFYYCFIVTLTGLFCACGSFPASTETTAEIVSESPLVKSSALSREDFPVQAEKQKEAILDFLWENPQQMEKIAQCFCDGKKAGIRYWYIAADKALAWNPVDRGETVGDLCEPIVDTELNHLLDQCPLSTVFWDVSDSSCSYFPNGCTFRGKSMDGLNDLGVLQLIYSEEAPAEYEEAASDVKIEQVAPNWYLLTDISVSGE